MQICKGWKEMSWKTEGIEEAQNQIGYCTVTFKLFFFPKILHSVMLQKASGCLGSTL